MSVEPVQSDCLPATPGRTLLPGVLLILLVVVYAALAPQTARHEDKDWSHLWLAGRMVVDGHSQQLYDPDVQYEVYRQADPLGRAPSVWERRYLILGCFNYPPPAALYYAAYAWLPMGTAAVLHAYVTIGLALATAWLLARSLAGRVAWTTVAVAVLVYPPFFVNLSLGQNAVVTLAVLAGAWYLFNKQRDLLGGMVLGLLICKPNWLFAVGWIPLIYGRWRMLAGMILGAGAAGAATALCLGAGPFVDYLDQFRKVANLHDLADYHLDVKYNALALFRKWLGIGSAASILGWTAAGVLILATWRVTRGGWQPGKPDFHRTWACCLLTALWINPHLNYYDLLPVALVVAAAAADWKSLHRSGRLAGVALLLLVYAAVPWDEVWTWRRVLPVPSLTILALWCWFAWGLRQRSEVRQQVEITGTGKPTNAWPAAT
ncbi:MAG: DUF2029 domain-containing protein [bacterium]|nr:DUF2029 domain-containing protein [bacterium]